MQKVSSKW